MSQTEAYKKWYEKNKEVIREYKRNNMRKYRKQNPDHYRAQSRKSKRKLVDQVFNKYGLKCVRCGFNDRRALTLDHVMNNGAEERKAIGERGVYRRSLKDQHTNEYQVLCMNCQFIKRREHGGDWYGFE